MDTNYEKYTVIKIPIQLFLKIENNVSRGIVFYSLIKKISFSGLKNIFKYR